MTLYPGGYWWPPAYSTWGPTIVSFIFLVLAQLTIFSNFSGPELPELFWGPKRRFWASFVLRIWFCLKIYIHGNSCSPQIDISNDVSYTSNGDRMPKLCPRKLKHQFTQTGPIVLVLHLLWLGFWTFRVLHCFSIINRPSSLIVT